MQITASSQEASENPRTNVRALPNQNAHQNVETFQYKSQWLVELPKHENVRLVKIQFAHPFNTAPNGL